MAMSLEPRFQCPTYLLRRQFLKIFGAAFHIYGPNGDLMFYSKQKAFRLKEDIRLYACLQIESITFPSRALQECRGAGCREHGTRLACSLAAAGASSEMAGARQEGPTWAPNGRVLMFFRESPGSAGGPKLYTIDLTGYNERQVATPAFGSDPAWSPLIN